jgi:hypothetical protein
MDIMFCSMMWIYSNLPHTELLIRARSNFRGGEIEVTAFSYVEGRKVRMPIGLVPP